MDQKYIILDNSVTINSIFNHLVYLYDKDCQDVQAKRPGYQPSIWMTFMKKRHFELLMNEKGQVLNQP